jgi:hypothetical protein
MQYTENSYIVEEDVFWYNGYVISGLSASLILW